MSIFDIFNNDAFKGVSMLESVDSVEFKPSRLGSMGVFQPTPIRTESIAIESRNNGLSLIKTTQRGEPVTQRTNDKRLLRNFNTVRIAKEDRISASEIAFIREHGEEQQVIMLQAELARRMTGVGGLVDDIDYTMEHMRLGAIQGQVLDADGSTVIYDWFSEFGITQATEIGFNLGAISAGDLREECSKLKREMSRKSGGTWTPSTRIHAMCGDNFWDALIKVEEVRAVYLNRQDSQYVENGGAYETINYGGITWENYQGSDDGTEVAIPADEVKFFPVGGKGAFLEVFSPGEKFEHIGQLGQIIYPEIVRDVLRDRYVDLEVSTYPLHVCTRPAMLQRGRVGA